MSEFIGVYAENLHVWLPRLLAAAVVTVEIALLAFALASAFGLALALIRLHGPRLASMVAITYIEVVRGIPVLVLLFVVYFTLPDAGLTLDSFMAAVLAFGLYVGAQMAEVFKAGILSVHRGQREAALAVGLTPLGAMRLVVLPQALRTVLPPLTNTAIALIKDTSLAAIIATPELTLRARDLATTSFRPMHVYLLAAAIYLILSLAVARVGKRLERASTRSR